MENSAGWSSFAPHKDPFPALHFSALALGRPPYRLWSPGNPHPPASFWVWTRGVNKRVDGRRRKRSRNLSTLPPAFWHPCQELYLFTTVIVVRWHLFLSSRPHWSPPTPSPILTRRGGIGSVGESGVMQKNVLGQLVIFIKTTIKWNPYTTHKKSILG